MRWPTVPLKEIAPAQTPNIRFSPDEPVWHLTLDQVESHTGNIVNKKIAPASTAGTSTNVFDAGNVLYSKLRPYLNKVICPTEPGIATTELIPLRPRKDLLDRRYLTYYLRSKHFLGFANVAVAGVKMPRIIMAKFWKHQVPLPPLSEQHRIVEILDQANALRKKRAEADAIAARILPGLFYKMFGDPATNPRGWDVVLLEDALADTRNGLYKHGDFYGRGTQILKMFNIQLGELELSRVDRVELTGDEAEKYALIPGDILINRVNTKELVGKCAVITSDLGPAVFESKNIRARLKPDWATPEFVAHYLNTTFGHAALCQGVKHAIGMATINNTDLRRMTIPRPPLELQQTWDGLVRQIRESQKSRRKVCERLDQLLDVLLHRAFTGDLTVKWRVAHMKELLAEMEAQAKALDCPSTQSNSSEVRSKRHAGHDMYNKAALAAYITDRCHAPDRLMGRVKLAKLFYLVQQKTEIELTETFMKRAAGPLDDEIHKFLSLAQKSKWLVLCRGEGDLKPVKPGANVSKAIEQAQKLLGPSKAKVDEMLDQMKGWGYRALERWATVLDASFELTAAGQPATVEGVKDIIQRHPDWVPKLSRDEFSDTNIEATLKGLRGFGFITNPD
ncbi:MAG: hypothetical protein Kow0025_06790 [Thermodesulfovibrionales bacterium]